MSQPVFDSKDLAVLRRFLQLPRATEYVELLFSYFDASTELERAQITAEMDKIFPRSSKTVDFALVVSVGILFHKKRAHYPRTKIEHVIDRLLSEGVRGDARPAMAG